MRDPLAVVGRFPPPLDGQAIATRRLADLLEDAAPVDRFNLNPGDGAFIPASVRFRPDAALYFLRRGRELRRWLAERPGHTVLWTGISASPLGHLRDALAMAPALRGHRAYGIVHHGGWGDLFASPLTRRSALRLVRQLSGVVFLSQTLADRAAPWVPDEKRLVVPNTIDDDLIPSRAEVEQKRETRAAAIASGDPVRVLFFSHMIPSKGYLDVLRAVGVLRQRGVAVRADFVGRWTSPEDEAAFRAEMDRLGVADRVVHHGGVSDRAAARAHYLAADVFCLPTTYPTEAQPLTIIEALAAGCPAVVTEHASLPEMIERGVSGTFVRASDPASIADGIARVAAGWRTHSAGARARFDAAFAPDAVRQQWLALLDG